jgi:hypothetical protein
MGKPLIHREECEFPGCDLEPMASGGVRCLLHVNVMVSASYLNDDEVKDEEQ